LEVITPKKVSERGAQLSVRVRAGRSAGRACFSALELASVLPDWREPDIIRISPAPLYNDESDIERVIEALSVYFATFKKAN
jgi:kynureninase